MDIRESGIVRPMDQLTGDRQNLLPGFSYSPTKGTKGASKLAWAWAWLEPNGLGLQKQLGLAQSGLHLH
jgi:hypothetical protein